MYRLIIKGNRFQVAEEVAKRGIAYVTHVSHNGEGQGFTNADVKIILEWFCETNNVKAPLPPGSLLFYTEVKDQWGVV